MTVRITQAGRSGGRILRIDGWLESSDLAEVERACGPVGGPLTLDLEGLRYANEPGLALLARLKGGGARLPGCSAYLAMRLDRVPPPGGEAPTEPLTEPGADPKGQGAT
jgi:hypothetical protein